MLNQACVSNKSRYPDAEMNTSGAGYRSNDGLFDLKRPFNTIYETSCVRSYCIQCISVCELASGHFLINDCQTSATC